MNYFECENETLLNSHFIFIDNDNYLSKDIFKDNEIRVKFKKIYDHPNSKYKIIFASTNKYRDFLFIKSMFELENMMMENGYEDYDNVCNEIFSNLSKPKKKVIKWKI